MALVCIGTVVYAFNDPEIAARKAQNQRERDALAAQLELNRRVRERNERVQQEERLQYQQTLQQQQRPQRGQ
jgi:Flp pilus assembly protein TadB